VSRRRAEILAEMGLAPVWRLRRAGSSPALQSVADASAEVQGVPVREEALTPASPEERERRILSMDWPALLVCRVENTRCPVSAAVAAVWIVCQSRISPTMITSGSCRIRFFRASGKLGVSVPTSRWETAALLSAKRYSIGSSIVTTETARVSMTVWRMAASVVDFPEPVGPVSRTRPDG